MPDFLHNHSDFSGLLAIVADERGIDPVLVEKDYWIMNFDKIINFPAHFSVTLSHQSELNALSVIAFFTEVREANISQRCDCYVI